MYKLKKSKSILKRLKFTKTGIVLRRQACKNHLLRKKTSEHKQKLKKNIQVFVGDFMNFKNRVY